VNPPQTVLLTGVSGAGKSTVGRVLADALGAVLVDADDLHPTGNVAKMSAGVPLTDEDRDPWVDRLVEELRRRESEGGRVVLACSALRRAHRRRLVGAVVDVGVVHLQVGPDVLARRLAERTGHFMSPRLLASQLAALEPLTGEGTVVDGERPVDEVVEEILGAWR
jgi:gluconokinase